MQFSTGKPAGVYNAGSVVLGIVAPLFRVGIKGDVSIWALAQLNQVDVVIIFSYFTS